MGKFQPNHLNWILLIQNINNFLDLLRKVRLLDKLDFLDKLLIIQLIQNINHSKKLSQHWNTRRSQSSFKKGG